MSKPVLIVTCALASTLVSQSSVSADVGQVATVATRAVPERAPWRGIMPRVSQGSAGSDSPLFMTWEHDVSPMERRFIVVSSHGQSIEESYERTAPASVRFVPQVSPQIPFGRDLAAALSKASFQDFLGAKVVATVPNKPLQLDQFFLRGKIWAYVYSQSDPSGGLRNTSWTQIALASLKARIAAAKACAGTGECGE